jgi:rubrerythrin
VRPLTLLARTIGLASWAFPVRTSRRLARFALAEEGSMVDLRIAARLTPSPERAAKYLEHAADEERHARMFRAHAHEWAERARASSEGPSHADVEYLFERLGETRFLAFVHRGERRGRMQFEHYRDHFARRRESRTAALFETILEDERRHEAYSRELLVALVGERGATRAGLEVAAWQAWRTWRRLGRAMGGALYVAVMTLVYLLSAPLAIALRLRARRTLGP